MSPVSINSSSGDLLADRRYAWADGLSDNGDFVAAADLLADVTAMVPHWPSGWFALATAREKAGDVTAAIEALQACAVHDPDDLLGARLHLARLGAGHPAPEMSQAYVRGLFDQYADRFDAHLTGALQYRGPALLREAILQACRACSRPQHSEYVIDLGCGTGLMAQALDGVAGAIHGIDLSPRMVALARATGLYADVQAGDIVEQLAACPAGRFDLVVAADVLVYLGDLLPVIAQGARVLAPLGLIAFTVQKRDTPGFGLGPDMRYHHSQSYIADIAAENGLKVVICTDASTRHDEGRPVPGLVVVLAR